MQVLVDSESGQFTLVSEQAAQFYLDSATSANRLTAVPDAVIFGWEAVAFEDPDGGFWLLYPMGPSLSDKIQTVLFNQEDA